MNRLRPGDHTVYPTAELTGAIRSSLRTYLPLSIRATIEKAERDQARRPMRPARPVATVMPKRPRTQETIR